MGIRPQKGFQEKFLSTPVDIGIGGACAGVGKTFAELLDGLRHIHIPTFSDTIFRRTTPQIRNSGGLWDESVQLYSKIPNVKSSQSTLRHRFPSGAEIRFSHLEYEKDIYSWQGSQLPSFKFDEMTHFTSRQFWYMISRNRSVCGIRPNFRGTCNPDPDSFVYELIQWWIDPDTGIPIPERDSVIRYMFKLGGKFIWGDNYQDVAEEAGSELKEAIEKANERQEGLISAKDLIKSVTFVGGSIYDNVELLKVNPQYLSNLLAQDEEEKDRLLHGNWLVRPSGTEIYNRDKFNQMRRNTEVGSSMLDAFGNPIDDNPYKNERFITADIALEGSDAFVVFVWEGFTLIDAEWMPKSDGGEVLGLIIDLAQTHRVPACNVCYDADGVGGYIGGFINASRAFHNGAKVKENYTNLKTMCFYRSGRRVNRNDYYILPKVADKIVNIRDNKTLFNVLLGEQRCIKKWKADMDGNLQIIPKGGTHTPEKPTMKGILGYSPDFMDAFMMREYFEIMPVAESADLDGLYGYEDKDNDNIEGLY